MQSYKIGDFKKSGATAKIYECDDVHCQRQLIAKTFRRNPNSRSFFNNERNMLQKFQHEGIIRIFDSFVLMGEPVLVLEKGQLDLTDLLTAQGTIPIQKLRKMFLPIFRAVEFMHSKGYVHCDIKPENIVIMNDNTLKIIDFGLCEEFLNQKSKPGRKGTVNYLAPEILADNTYGYQVDVWALGVTLFTAATSRSPFEGDGYNYICNVVAKAPRMNLLKDIDQEGLLTDLIEKMLDKDPQHRPTMKECLVHKFFCSENN